MPRRYKKSYSRRRRKPSYRRKRTNKFTSLSAPIPNSVIAKLRYVDQVQLDAGVSGIATHTFRANSIFDPDFSGTGHACKFKDQYMGMFYNYTVLGSKITVQAAATSDVLSRQVISINLSDASTVVGSTLDAVLESRNTVWKSIGTATGGHDMVTIRKNFSGKRFWANKNMMSDEFQGSSSTNPDEEAYYHITTSSFDPVADPAAVDLVVTIEYIVKFHGPRIVAQS